jgi:photosynthetic reaction center cytochrome c subunit
MQDYVAGRFQMGRTFRTCFAVVAGMAMCTLGSRDLRAQGADAKTAEQVYKNIIQLKGTPADQLTPAMQFISASLGVDCEFCHVQGKFEADDKGAKKTAREMMAMTAAINKNSFGGRLQVTCNTCHRGSERPVNVPAVLESDAPSRPEARPASPSAAAGAATTADEIVAKYIAAVGGADSMKKITSRIEKGKILVGGNATPIELFTKGPNKRISISNNPNGHSITAFDGTMGWLGTEGRSAREMSAAESWAAGLDAEFYLATRLKEIFPQIRRGRPEEIAGVMCESLNATAPGHPPVRLSFDQKSGLLVRMVRFADTPMGRNPTQIDYADYREVDGVKIPYRWTLSRPNGRFTIQIDEVKDNAPVEDARFAKPAAEVK